jgi:uncharacterized protein (TIGR01777 family)
LKALVTGATGLIGGHLVAKLDHPRVLARSPERATAKLGAAEAFAWSASEPVPRAAIEDVDVVFHLAGEPISGRRLTAARKQEFRDSRILGTRRIVEALRDRSQASAHPTVLVSASATGFYGTRGDEELTEESPPGDDFFAELCADWEKEARAAETFGVRVVCVRIGIVFAPEGGAFAPLRRAFSLGVGGPLGSGEQWMSWIHIDDIVGLLFHAAERPDVTGALNLCAPTPERNKDFARTFGRVMHRPSFMPMPAFALRLVIGDMADLALASQRILPAKALATGYAFRYPTLEGALRDVVR